MLRIRDIAVRAGIPDEHLYPYGWYKAKVDHKLLETLESSPDGTLIFVTAITPTPMGEGKTSIAIALADALSTSGQSVILALREPSLGPVFGVKGGATGALKARVIPSEDIDLLFNGDFYAVNVAHNLLASMIDNHIHHRLEPLVDLRRVTFPRVTDLSDRALRKVVIGLGGKANGYPRETEFIITSASEIMAILALATSLEDLKERLARIHVGYTLDGKPVLASHINGAVENMLAILRNAFNPNLVQTAYGTPTFIHTGPFANIAHGNSSVIATKLALKLANFVVTEGGFGSDLGFEKFMHIVARPNNLKPSAVVLVASCKALRYHGGNRKEANKPDLDALRRGLKYLRKHVEIIRRFNLEPVIALNLFGDEAPEEIEAVLSYAESLNVRAVATDAVAKGPNESSQALVRALREAIEENSKREIRYVYDPGDPIEEKIEKLVREVYGGEGVEISPEASKKLKLLRKLEIDELPICVAKTQLSLTDKPNADFEKPWKMKVRDFWLSYGAGFVIPIAGDINLLPGLPKRPRVLS